jgi:hypothetical protein
MRYLKIFFQIFLLIFFLSFVSFAQKNHPNLVLTKKGVENIKANLGKLPLFDKSFGEARLKVEQAISSPIDVPIPKDPGGGYTHEKHKQNYNEMYLAGILFQVTGDEKYAVFIKNMLDKYANMYPGLSLHPQKKDQTPGKLFWQSLNETVWLLHSIQAYDCIYGWLSNEVREKYEQNIFIPMAKFFSEKLHHEFDLIHNHGTWMVASVGMTAFVLNKPELIEKSLYGSNKKEKGGFLAQLRLLFSPDGYYTEGGYYVRYALWPFFIFAESIQNNLPELKIYEYRDQILKKAFYSALQMTYTNGAFMPINDALKEKTFLSTELVYALNFVFERYERELSLLKIAKLQNRVTLTDGGLEVAKALAEAKELPDFNWHSVEYKDGPNGDEGGVGILRWGEKNDMETLLFKYSAHGLSHGHFDKLSFLFYDQGREIIQDYGAARFLNVEQKAGGRYLPENKSFAMQTIAHNTVTVDEKSHFKGRQEISEKFHSERYCFYADNLNFQYMSAKDNHAYDGVKMHRTFLMVYDRNFLRPVIIDVFKLTADKEHQYDLPYYYMGHFISTNFDYKPFISERKAVGEKNGYQHLWKTAEGKSDGTSNFTWLNGERYYSITSNTDENTQIIFAQIGANDPNFNLRNEEAIIFRTKAKDHVFATVIEPHGEFNPTLEYSFNSYSAFEKIDVIHTDDELIIISIDGKKNLNWTCFIVSNDPSKDKIHSFELGGEKYSWTGPIHLHKN